MIFRQSSKIDFSLRALRFFIFAFFAWSILQKKSRKVRKEFRKERKVKQNGTDISYNFYGYQQKKISIPINLNFFYVLHLKLHT